MTTTYDFDEPAFWDEADMRAEFDRVADLCHGCRLCWNLCPSFDTLFDVVDGTTDGIDVHLAAADQDRIVDGCFQCKLCHVKCPYVPPHDWQLDFPKLMLRALAVRTGGRPKNTAAALLARTDLTGIVAGLGGAPVAAALKPNGPVRKVLQAATGIDAGRLLPSFATRRFTTWWRLEGRDESVPVYTPPDPDPDRDTDDGSGAADTAAVSRDVTLFPSCMVEYQEPEIGKAVVRVLRHNGCDVACNYATCCGVPDLDAGDVGKFLERAKRNVDALLPEARAGRTIVVPSPTCNQAMRHDYPTYLGTPEARQVADSIADPAGYLWTLQRAGGLADDFTAPLGTVAYHASCHLRAQRSGYRARDLLRLVPDTNVRVVEGCAGIDGTWGYRKENAAVSKAIGATTAAELAATGADVCVGDCHLADVAFAEAGVPGVVHPMQALARAYGLDGDDG